MAIRSKRGTSITAKAKAREIILLELKELDESLDGFLVNQHTREMTNGEREQVRVEVTALLGKMKDAIG